MTDLVQRLRGLVYQEEWLEEAAAEIERLTADNERLRAALNAAADDLELYGDDGTGHTSSGPQSAADKARRAALSSQQP